MSSDALPEELKRKVLAAVQATPAPTRQATRTAELGMLAGALMVLAVLCGLLGGVILGDRPLTFVVGTTAGWALFALGTSWAALGRGRRMGGLPTSTLVTTALLAPVLLFVWLVLWNRFYLPESCAPGISAWGTSCHELIVAMSAVMFIAFAAIRRFGDPVHPKASGALLGVAAASWAGLVVNLRCTCATVQHVGVGHVLPLAVASAAGTALGWWLLRLRRTPR